MRKDKGSAILLVIFVLAVIMAVAIPLTYFCQLDYQRAKMSEARAKARLATEGAVDHALSYAMLTAEGAERTPGSKAPYNTPTYDSYQEFAVDYSLGLYPDLASIYLSNISFANPAGLIWHSDIEDEQGKININSAPSPLLGNLLGSAILTEPLGSTDNVMYVDTALFFDADNDPATIDGILRVGWEGISYKDLTETTVESLGRNENAIDETRHAKGTLVYDARAYDAAYGVCQGTEYVPYAATVELSRYISYYGWRRIADCVTIHSSTEGATGWQRSEAVTAVSEDKKGMTVADAKGFGIGTTIRVLINEEPELVGRVEWVRAGGRRNVVWLDRPIDKDIEDKDIVTLQARLPHPVNINTANRRTLAAIFKGVGLMGTNESVDVTKAEALAELAMDRVFTGPDDFKTFLNEAVDAGLISGRDRDALYMNATEPNSTALRLVTVPFTYRSYGDVTLIGRVVANDRQGRVLSRRSEQMVVSIPAEEDGQWGLSSQEEFEKQRVASNSPLVVTWPESVKADKSPDAHGIDPETGQDPLGDVRLLAADDERPFKHGTLTEHFDKEKGYTVNPDGADFTKGGSIKYETDKGFSRGNGLIVPGYFGMWAQCPNWGGRTRHLLSLGNGSDTDMIAFYYDGRSQELVAEIAGPDRDPRKVAPWVAKYKMNFSPEDGDWYHLAFRFSGNKPGEVTFYVDGRVPDAGGVSYWIGDKRAARLAGAVAEADDKLDVDNTSSLGNSSYGVVQIGQEVIEYNKRSGSALMDLHRGCRYTAVGSHGSNDLVVPYGYSNQFSADLPRGGETLVSNVAAFPNTLVASPVQPSDTSITVTSTDGFQDSGFIRIVSEFIYYASKTKTSFDGCQRAQMATTAGTYDPTKGGQFSVIGKSLLVSGRSDYKTGRDVSILSADGTKVEWVEIGQIIERNKNTYFTPNVWKNAAGVIQEGAFRGTHATAPRDHNDKADVVPVAELSGPQCGNWDLPFDEQVTVIDGTFRERTTLSRGFCRYWPVTDKDGDHIFMASPKRCLSKAMAANARFLKFPSGELPLTTPGQFQVAAQSDGSNELQAVIDELRMASSLSVTGIVPPGSKVNGKDAIITVIGDTITRGPAHVFPPTPPQNGLLRIGSEYVFYRNSGSGSYPMKWGDEPQYNNKRDTRKVTSFVFQDCLRGVLGSVPTAHDAGERVEFLDEYPASLLSGNIDEKTDTVGLLNAALFPPAGYVLAGSEVIGWTVKEGNSLTGCQYLHGRYGTAKSRHMDGTMCISLPFRYHSRYEPLHDGNDLAYFAAARSIKGAVWRNLTYELAKSDGGEAAAEGMKVRVVLNPDGAYEWSEKPTNKANGLLMYDDEGSHILPRVRADEMAVRVYFDYQPGAFSGNGWKRTLRLENLFLDYKTPLVVRRDDVIEQ